MAQSASFWKKGYEAVSIQDILDAESGAQEMFYQYFKSKQDIFCEAMNRYIDKAITDKVEILNDGSHVFTEKRNLLRETLEDEIPGCLMLFGTDVQNGAENNARREKALLGMLEKLREPYAKFILQGVREGHIKDTDINESNVSDYALCTLRGIYSVLYDAAFNQRDSSNTTLKTGFRL